MWSLLQPLWGGLLLLGCREHPSALLPPQPLPLRLVDLAADPNLPQPPPEPRPPTVLLQDNLDTVGCMGEDSLIPWTPPALEREVSISPGDTLQVSVQVHTEDLVPRGRDAAGAGMQIVLLDGDGAILQRVDDLPRWSGHSGATARPLTAMVTAPAGTERLRIQLIGAAPHATGRVCFSALSVVQPSPEQAGEQLPPAGPSAHPLARRVTLGKTSRPALLSPGPSTWAMAVPRDQDAQLRLSVGQLPGLTATRVCMRVRDASAGESLWSSCQIPDDAWLDVRLDLSARPGTTSELHLETSLRGELGAVAVWGDPSVLPVPAATDPPALPDLVLVVVDTLRADHLGVEGYTVRQTSPLLDAFARKSLRFSAAQATSPWTAPSLGSVMTGLLPSLHRAGSRRVRAWNPESLQDRAVQKNSDYLQLSAAIATLPERLRAAGYETIGVSTNGFFGPLIGFDRGYAQHSMISTNNLAGGRLVAQALAALEADRAPGPRFLSLHFVDPHHPYRMRLPSPEGFPAPTDFMPTLEERNGQRALVLREIVPEARPHPAQVATLYDAEIRYLDHILGPLLEALDDGQTTIVFLSDHGEGFQEHGHYIHGNSMYQELLHVPLWVRSPQAAAGTVTAPVSLLDVAPTLLAAAGLSIPEDLAGQPLPLDGSAPVARLLVAEGMYQGNDQIAVREGDWKLILTLPEAISATTQILRAVKGPRVELLNLRDDPGETTDLSSSLPEQVERLRAQVEGHVSQKEPGLQIRCDDAASGRVVPLPGTVAGTLAVIRAEPGSKARIDPSRQAVEVEGGPLQVVVRTVGGVPPETLPGPEAEGGCVAWWNAGAGGGGEQESTFQGDDAAALRAMGYLE